MKKIIVAPLLLFVLSLSLTSCKKDIEDRLPGDWNVRIMSTDKFSNNADAEVIEATDNSTGTATFNEDGTGSISADGFTLAFSWSTAEEKVIMNYGFSTQTYTVLVDEEKSQHWETNETETWVEDSFDENSNPITITYSRDSKVELEMEKK
jgi:hypothetical protein